MFNRIASFLWPNWERHDAHGGYRADIDGLRAIAVVGVLIYHAFPTLLPGGFVGVDVFFVISGFVMVQSVAGRAVAPSRFMMNRIRRIVPMYWLGTLVVLGFYGSGGLVLKSLLFVPVYNPHTQMVQPLLEPGWTLNYEMAFYCVFALTLLLPERLRLPVVASLFAVAVLAGRMISGGDVLTFYTRPIMLEFVFGMAIAQYRLRLPTLAAPLGLLAMAVLYPLEIGRIWSLGLPGAMIVAGALQAEARLPRLAIPEFLGSASYAIYLFHLPALFIVLACWPEPAFGPWAFVAVAFSAMLLVGCAAHRVVELPLTALLAHCSTRKGKGTMRSQGAARA